MPKKILIAIRDNFIRKMYSKIFEEGGFEILETDNGKKALDLAKKEVPDIILADIFLPEIGGFELIKSLKEETATQRIPVMIFTQVEREEDRLQAMELEAKDFIVGALTPPLEIILRAKILLGEQKTYRLAVLKNFKDAKNLAKDLGFSPTLTCSHCGSSLLLFLMMDLSKGKNYFKVSFICPQCG